MQLESLKMFCDVVETGSFSRAGRLSRVSQSAVSQQILKLETRYMQRLLSRRGGRVRLTAAGERLFRGSKDILTRFGEVESETRQERSEVSGVSTVSTIYSVGLDELHSVQEGLARSHPGVQLVLKHRQSDQVYEDVILGAADLGLVAYPEARGSVEVIPFREEPLAVIISPAHALARRSKLPLAVVAASPFIAFDHTTPTGAGIERLFSDHGIKLRPTMELHNVESIKRAVEEGLGIAVLPLPAARHELASGALVARPLAEGAWTRPVGLLVSRDQYLNRASRAVLHAFKLTTLDAGH